MILGGSGQCSFWDHEVPERCHLRRKVCQGNHRWCQGNCHQDWGVGTRRRCPGKIISLLVSSKSTSMVQGLVQKKVLCPAHLKIDCLQHCLYFRKMAPNKMQGHFWHHFLIQIFILFYMVACILFSTAAPITTYFKDSNWLLRIFSQ